MNSRTSKDFQCVSLFLKCYHESHGSDNEQELLNTIENWPENEILALEHHLGNMCLNDMFTLLNCDNGVILAAAAVAVVAGEETESGNKVNSKTFKITVWIGSCLF